MQRRGSLLLLLSLIVSMGSWPSAAVGEWMVKPRISVREIYTDNIELAPNDRDDQFVTEVIPGVFVRGDGRRFRLDLLFNLDAVLFPSGDFDNNVYPQLQAAGTAEVIEELLFLDIDSTISQTNADNTRRLASDNISQTGNRIDTYTYRVSPFLRNRMGSFAQSELRYTFDEVINEGDTVNSKAHRGRLQIDSGSRFARLPWELFADVQTVDFDDGATVDLRLAGAKLRYRIRRQFSIFGSSGYEFNDFDTNRNDEKDVFWQAGAAWTPSPRTSFEGGYGERFFGGNFFFNIEHQRRRFVFRAAFEEDVSLTRDVELDAQLVRLEDPFGQPIAEPSGNIRVATNRPTSVSEVFVRKRFDGSLAFRGRRTGVVLEGFHEVREFQETLDDETVIGASADIARRLSRRATLRIGGRWEKTDFRAGAREDTRWEGSVGLAHRIARSLDGLIEYRYTNQDSDDRDVDFEENRITLSLSVKF